MFSRLSKFINISSNPQLKPFYIIIYKKCFSRWKFSSNATYKPPPIQGRKGGSVEGVVSQTIPNGSIKIT